MPRVTASPRRPRGLAPPPDHGRKKLAVGRRGGEPEASTPAVRLGRTAHPSRAAQVRGRADGRDRGGHPSTGRPRGGAVQRHALPGPVRSAGGGRRRRGAAPRGDRAVSAKQTHKCAIRPLRGSGGRLWRGGDSPGGVGALGRQEAANEGLGLNVRSAWRLQPGGSVKEDPVSQGG